MCAVSANASLELSINDGEPFSGGVVDIGLGFGQGFTINIWSDSYQPYNAYIGISKYEDLQGTLSLVTITPNAGSPPWSVVTWDTQDYSGFQFTADGSLGPITPGVHFIFDFVYDQYLGWKTSINLLDNDATTVIAGIDVYDIPEPTSLLFLTFGIPILLKKIKI